MAKVAVLLPNLTLNRLALPLVDKFPSITLMGVEYVRTDEAVARALELEQKGCDIIIARGVQARLIGEQLPLPVIEITVTQQELGSVLIDLKAELGIENPRIGLVGFPNMLSDTSQFDRLFGVELRRYMVHHDSQLRITTTQAIQDGCHAIIGGSTACEQAEREGIPFRLIPNGAESLRNALQAASGIAYAIDLQRNKTAEMDSETRRELYRRGFVARHTFENTICNDPETRREFEVARRISKFHAPVLLTGEVGSGKGELAECMHNASPFCNNAFVTIDCSAWQADTLDTMLFGNYLTHRESSGDSYAELAQGGTLYLRHVDMLPYETQYKILLLIQGRFQHNGPCHPVDASVRVIASTPINLVEKVESGEFRSDLYYALNVLSVAVMPLRCRRDDIEGWMQLYLGEQQKKYKRYVRLTQGAWQYLHDYDWPGNLNQLRSLCERIMLLTTKRSIDEVFLQEQMEQVVPTAIPGTEQVVLYQDKKALMLEELMERHHGNRQKMADELGVSKTTLWRYLKKYNIKPM